MKAVKWILGMIPVVLIVAALGGAVYLGLNPEKGEELRVLAEEKLGDKMPFFKKAPTLELSAEVKQPEMSYDLPKDLIEPSLGIVLSDAPSETVYTWFRDVDGDLWLPCPNMGADAWGEDSFVAGQQGILKRMDAGVCVLDPARGEICVPREVLDELVLGDYWLGFRLFASGEEYYLPFAVCVRDESVFRSPQVGLATRGINNGILYDAGAGGDLTFHLYNLGENRITQLSTLNRPPLAEAYSPSPLSGGDYVISEDGHSVTLTEEYLQSRIMRTNYYFRFELGDGTWVDTTPGSEWEVYLVPYEGDYDMPYLRGPYTYSASAGGDYVLEFHMGDAVTADFGDAGIDFALPGGIMENRFDLTFDPENIREDGTYVIPASVFQDAIARGCDYYLVSQSFYVSSTGWITAAYSGRIVP